jgi:AcrR family transcriptional regulator
MRIFKRMRILASARAIYAAEGREGLSLRKVGDAAGLSAPALYRYYHGKEMLVDALAEHASIELTNRMRRSLGSPTPMLRLERATRIVLEYGMRYPRLMELLLTTRQPASGPFAFLRARVDECVRAGALWNDDRRELALTIWAQIRGLLSLRGMGEDKEFRALYRRAMGRLLAAHTRR